MSDTRQVRQVASAAATVHACAFTRRDDSGVRARSPAEGGAPSRDAPRPRITLAPTTPICARPSERVCGWSAGRQDDKTRGRGEGTRKARPRPRPRSSSRNLPEHVITLACAARLCFRTGRWELDPGRRKNETTQAERGKRLVFRSHGGDPRPGTGYTRQRERGRKAVQRKLEYLYT